MNPSSPTLKCQDWKSGRWRPWRGLAGGSQKELSLPAGTKSGGERTDLSLAQRVPLTHTFLIVSSMDLPPFHGLVDLRMQLRLAMLCHFRSSSFLWKALASIRTLSYR